MKQRIAVMTWLLALVTLAGTALAIDYWGGPPPDKWTRGEPGTTMQHWMFTTDEMGPPEVYDNPFGVPWVTIETGNFEWGEWPCPTQMDPRGFIEGIHCNSPEGGSLVLHIPNSPDFNIEKTIFLQITSSKAPQNVGVIGMGQMPPYSSGYWVTGRPAIQWPDPAPFGGSWYTYNYGRWISPNPQQEDIVIDVTYCTVIDQIVVDTLCSPGVVSDEETSWSGVKALFR